MWVQKRENLNVRSESALYVKTDDLRAGETGTGRYGREVKGMIKIDLKRGRNQRGSREKRSPPCPHEIYKEAEKNKVDVGTCDRIQDGETLCTYKLLES